VPAKTLFSRFLADRSGETAIEYGLICSLIFLAIVVAVNNLANANKTMYNAIRDNMV
jgi:pilus assembly protein Flp/PilA